jgi:hypothetical protein
MLARLTRTSHRPAEGSASAAFGGVAVAKLGETACGDSWAAATRRTGVTLTVVDGLGHGPLAAEAADLAVRAFEGHVAARPRDVLEAMHVALHGTRGAAAAVAELDREHQLLTFAGVGNISGAVISAGTMRSMVSHNGIVGQVMPNLQEFTYPWPTGALVVMHSDGVTPHWNLDAYPGLAHRHPTLIAAVLYRDFTRGRDDATVVVVRGLAP